MNFSDKLKELRQSKGISQAKLAEEIFVSRFEVAKCENGLDIPSDESLELLAKYFNINAEELLEIKKMKNSLLLKIKQLKIKRQSLDYLLV